MATRKKAVVVFTPPAPCRKDRSDDYKKCVALQGLDTIRSVIEGQLRIIADAEAMASCHEVRYVDALTAAVEADWAGESAVPGLTAIIHLLSHADDLCAVAHASNASQEAVAMTVARIRTLHKAGYAVPAPDLNDVVSRVAVSVATAMEALLVRTCLTVDADCGPHIVLDVDALETVNAYSEAIVTTWIQQVLFAPASSPYLTVPFTADEKANRGLQKKVRVMVQGLQDMSSPTHIVASVLRYLRALLKVRTVCLGGATLTGRHIVALRADLIAYLGNCARQVLTTDGTLDVARRLHEQLDRARPADA